MVKKVQIYSIIDGEAVFEGTLTCKGEMLVNGTIKGTLNGETITIGQTGMVYADTMAQTVTIGGKFQGRLDVSNRLIIRSTGSCEGEIKCRDLVVEPGGILNGKITRLPPSEHIVAAPKKKFLVFNK